MTSKKVLRVVELSRSTNVDDRVTAARSKFLPVNILTKLAEDNDREAFWVRQVAIKNPNLPTETINKIYDEALLSVGSSRLAFSASTYITFNHSLSSEKLDEYLTLAFEEKSRTAADNNMRRGALMNPNCPEKWLELVSRSEITLLRRFVGSNPSLPVKCQKLLLEDSDMNVRREVTRNKNVSLDLLKAAVYSNTDMRLLALLAGRLDGVDREEAVNRLRGSMSSSIQARKAVAQYTSDTSELKELTYYGSSTIRRIVLNNPATLDEDKVAVALFS